MTILSPEQTLRHIEHKVAMRELSRDVADRMIALHGETPSRSYRELHVAALHRPLPDTAFHVTDPRHHLSILERGLQPSDPATGWRSQPPYAWLSGQPRAVYLSDVYEAMRGAHSRAVPFHVWRVDGLDELAPDWQHDRFNPTCWAVLSPIHPRMLSLHATIR